MSKKTLLNESQIRSFMKLAKLEPLTPGFVQGLTESADDLDEGRKGAPKPKAPMRKEEKGMGMYRDEDMDESHGRGVGENPPHARGPLEEAEEEEMEVDAAEMEDAAGDEMEMDAEMDAEVEAPVEDADAGRMVSVDDFLAALERALEDAMGEEVEIDSDEVADDEPADAMDDMADEPKDADEMGDEEALMETITKRVAKRILMEALNTKK